MLFENPTKTGEGMSRVNRSACRRYKAPAAMPAAVRKVTAILEGRYLWGDQALYDQASKRFWSDVVPGSEAQFVAEKLAERNARLALDISLGSKAHTAFANAGVGNWRSLVVEDCAQVQIDKPTEKAPAKAYAIFFLDAPLQG